MDTLLAYVIGMSTTEAAWLTTVARSGETEAAFIARLCPPPSRPRPATTTSPTPTPTRRGRDDPVVLRNAKFAYGLEVVLDGLALRLPRG